MPNAIVNSLFGELLNAGNLEIADHLVSPDFAGPGGKGPEGFKAAISPLLRGFPDLHFTVHDIVTEGSRVMVRWTSMGTHGGPFAGVAPTGRRVSNEGISIYRIENGKIAASWSQIDRLGVLQQIGAMPPTPESVPAHKTGTPDRL